MTGPALSDPGRRLPSSGAVPSNRTGRGAEVARPPVLDPPPRRGRSITHLTIGPRASPGLPAATPCPKSRATALLAWVGTILQPWLGSERPGPARHSGGTSHPWDALTFLGGASGGVGDSLCPHDGGSGWWQHALRPEPRPPPQRCRKEGRLAQESASQPASWPRRPPRAPNLSSS